MQQYQITFRTVNSKKRKQFGLTVKLLRAEELKLANEYRWHWYEWISRCGKVLYKAEFLSKRLFCLYDLLLRRSKRFSSYQRSCTFQIDAHIPPAGFICEDGQRVLLGTVKPKFAPVHCRHHKTTSDCYNAVVSFYDSPLDRSRLIRHIPAAMDRCTDADTFFWMRRATVMHSLPQLAVVLAQLQLPAYVSVPIASFALSDSWQTFCRRPFHRCSDKTLVVLFQMAREMVGKYSSDKRLCNALAKLWLRATRSAQM